MDKSILTRGVTRIESTSLPCSAAGLHNGQLQSVAFHVSSSNLFSDSLSFLFLKLGAGLGYASIVAARCGFSRVLATDGDVNLIPFTRSNAHDNAVSAIMRVEALSWNDTDTLEALVPSGMMTPDVIFASDVIYIGSSEAWGSFLTLVARLCRRRRNEMLAASSSSDAASSSDADAQTMRPAPEAISRHDGSASAAGDPLVLLSHTRRYANEEEEFFREARQQRFDVTALPESALHSTWAGGRSQLFELRWWGDAREDDEGVDVGSAGEGQQQQEEEEVEEQEEQQRVRDTDSAGDNCGAEHN